MLLIAVLIVMSFAELAFAQLPYQWTKLTLPRAADRYNDVWFITPALGWAIIPSEIEPSGHIYKTTDGGLTWVDQHKSGLHLRSVCFLDSLTGFVGILHDGSSSPLLKTTNSGATWEPVEIAGPIPHGICGMFKVDDSTIVGTGQVFGPAHFIRTTDMGKTWSSIELNEFSTNWGIDCYFWSKDSGIVAGGTSDGNAMSAQIWRTSDGGQTWESAYTGELIGEWCWKISFPTEKTGYIALQQNTGRARYLKTTDGGARWQRHEIASSSTHMQGCGFVSEHHGWIGGRSFGAQVTTDGGETWSLTKDLQFVNRLRFFGDSVGYAAGDYVYKMTKAKSHVQSAPSAAALRFENGIVYGDQTAILRVYDRLGRTISEAPYMIQLSLFLPGLYFIRADGHATMKVIR